MTHVMNHELTSVTVSLVEIYHVHKYMVTFCFVIDYLKIFPDELFEVAMSIPDHSHIIMCRKCFIHSLKVAVVNCFVVVFIKRYN